MTKQKLSELLRQYVKNNLSPSEGERRLIATLYEAFQSALGGNCLLVGSYARFTASRPVHDLDLIVVNGKYEPEHIDPQAILTNLQDIIEKKFRNPTTFKIKISQQTHSITVSFLKDNDEQIAVDLVPAFVSGLKNEFGEDIYWVPEILKVGRRKRAALYEKLNKMKKNENEWWIKSDPRGYVKAAANLNSKNNDFRKVVKFVKRWKHNCKEKSEDFKLKSFHLEQIVFGIMTQNPIFDICDTIFTFFCGLPEFISQPSIRDRADSEKFIDEYLKDLTRFQRDIILEARDSFLRKLEYFSENSNISELLAADFYRRARSSAGICTEQYLFDFKIPVYLEADKKIRIQAIAMEAEGGFRQRLLDAIGLIERSRKIQFKVAGDIRGVDYFKWKVRNDNKSKEPRGEITDHHTKNDPEETRYRGSHYVECYAIRESVCIARARQGVQLGSDGE